MRRLTHGTERCGRGALRVTALLTLLSALLVPAAASAADFTPAPGSYTADTTTLKLTGPGTDVTGVNQGGVAVFSFDDVNIPSGANINAIGSRPFKIVASGNLTLAGDITSNGTDTSADFADGPFAGGAGGGAGGVTTGNAGAGPGGGGAQPAELDGAAGGGFGGAGARGGRSGVDGATTGVAPAGPAYGNLNGGPLQGGSGGAAGASTGGGGGGGAVALFGDFVTLTSGAVVFADGGGGAVGGGGGSGGGSGGGILVHGNTVDVSGALVARGGPGGAGGCCGDGGGGGGGRIAYQYRTLVSSGTALVAGGTSGSRATGAYTSGGASADATGAAGVVTKIQAASSNTGPATGISANGATMNGTINPHLSTTTFHFDFGTTTAYGTRAPASDAPVGSDATDHVVSQALGGLAPSTTYHYRLVATDSLGFVTTGADVGFTTPAATGGGGGGGTPPPTVLPSTVSSRWNAFRKYTKVAIFAVNDLPAAARVRIQCKTKKKKQQKKGCPYKSRSVTTTFPRSRLSVLKPFKKKRMPVGTRITITITATGYIGKEFSFTIRKAKVPKRPRKRCIPPGGKPARCA